MNSLVQSKGTARSFSHAFLLTLVLGVCFTLSPAAQAVTPTPDGLYSGANTAEGGAGALFSLTTGNNNTALGSQALFSLTTGIQNTATGAQALRLNTADANTADGFQALSKNTTGSSNTASGWRALFQNTFGSANTANGHAALYRNTTGLNNTAVGSGALASNTTGTENTATGALALNFNVGGHGNTAVGSSALASNTTGGQNTATGEQALIFNITGFWNTAVGGFVLFNNTSGTENTAVGLDALSNNTTGNQNIALGVEAGERLITGNNNIYIANQGVASESNTIRIGDNLIHTAAFIAGINGATASRGTAVFIDANGQLGTLTSSARFKDGIKPMDKASESIFALKPVTFCYKKEVDTKGIPQFGLVAEDVVKVNPDLVVPDRDGKPYSVRYEAINAMLLNEFLKEHRTVEKLEATVAQQRKDFEAAVAQLTAQVQRVSVQLEVDKAAPQTALNNQ